MTHLVLFATTFCTVTFAGSLLEILDRVGSFWDVVVLYVTRPSVLLLGLPFSVCLIAILSCHEMGHYLACRYYGIPASLPYFIPGPPPFGTFGAVIRIRGVIPHRRALFDVAAAGPIAGFVVAVPVLVVGLLGANPVRLPPSSDLLVLGSPLLSVVIESLLFGFGQDLEVGSLYLAGWFGLLVTSMNLFPVGQLDGGHAAYAVSRRFHRLVSRVTLVGMLGLVVFEAIVGRTIPPYSLWCVVLLFLRDRHPRLVDEEAPLGIGRAMVALVLVGLFVASFIPRPF